MKIVTRAEWGAASPRRTPVPVTWTPGAFDLHLHHTAGPQSQTPREIQEFHQRVRMWNDVGYHYLVHSDGTVYEGRGRNVEGAHSPDVNDEPGVALIGTYSTIDPSEAQRRAVWELLDMLGGRRIRGHRDSFATECPGDAAYRMIVEGPRPAGTGALERKPEPMPTGELRLAIQAQGGATRRWADDDAWNALAWIVENGLDYRSRVTLAFRGQIWSTERRPRRSPAYIRRVAATLVNRHIEEEK